MAFRWPWSRQPDPEPPAARRTPHGPGTTPAAMGWAFLPPIQRQLAAPIVTLSRDFEPGAWRSPGFTGDLTHAVTDAGPAGVIDGDGRGLGQPLASPAPGPELPLLPPPRPTGQRSLPRRVIDAAVPPVGVATAAAGPAPPAERGLDRILSGGEPRSAAVVSAPVTVSRSLLRAEPTGLPVVLPPVVPEPAPIGTADASDAGEAAADPTAERAQAAIHELGDPVRETRDVRQTPVALPPVATPRAPTVQRSAGPSTSPTSAASSSPGRVRPRLGLGAPLQRIPDTVADAPPATTPGSSPAGREGFTELGIPAPGVRPSPPAAAPAPALPVQRTHETAGPTSGGEVATETATAKLTDRAEELRPEHVELVQVVPEELGLLSAEGAQPLELRHGAPAAAPIAHDQTEQPPAARAEEAPLGPPPTSSVQRITDGSGAPGTHVLGAEDGGEANAETLTTTSIGSIPLVDPATPPAGPATRLTDAPLPLAAGMPTSLQRSSSLAGPGRPSPTLSVRVAGTAAPPSGRVVPVQRVPADPVTSAPPTAPSTPPSGIASTTPRGPRPVRVPDVTPILTGGAGASTATVQRHASALESVPVHPARPATGALPGVVNAFPHDGFHQIGPVTRVQRSSDLPVADRGPAAQRAVETPDVPSPGVQPAAVVDGAQSTTALPASLGNVPGSAATSATAPGGVQDDDALARRLFPPMLRLLRSELLVDRERRGLRTDRW